MKHILYAFLALTLLSASSAHAAPAPSSEAAPVDSTYQSLPQLIALYNVKQNTIVSHLNRYVHSGGAIDPARILALSKLTKDDQARVLQVMAQLGSERLGPVFEALDGMISYDELHVMRTYSLAAAVRDQ